MELATIYFWSWIIPLLSCIAGALLGYWFGLKKDRAGVEPDELEALQEKQTQLEIELAQCRENVAGPEAPAGKKAFLFDPKAAKAAFGRRIKQDDLKLVEGIGPKIEGLFHNFDIKTWKTLSETPVAKCREVLDSGGDRFHVHDPASWPMQARMAFEGKWRALARWQDEHKHGKL